MHKKNLRTHREALEVNLAQSVLKMSVPICGEDGTIWGLLQDAQRALAEAVEIANKELRGNPVAEIVAEHAMRKVGKRGFPHIMVDTDGSVLLVVDYDAPTVVPVTPVAEPRMTLPPISDLRNEADALGIPWAPFGKNKTALIAALNAARAKPEPATVVAPPVARPSPPPPVVVTAPPPPPPAPVVKAPQPVAAVPPPQPPQPVATVPPVKVVAPDTRKVLPDEDDDGLSDFFKGAPAKPIMAPVTTDTTPVPLRRPTPAGGQPAKTFGGRTLSSLAGKAESEVDIEAILAKPPGAVPASGNDSGPSDD